MKYPILSRLSVILLSAFAFSLTYADEQADLAMKLSNPVASLISVPVELNYDENIGPAEEGSVYKLNVQPVIPMSLSEDWNLISRTILSFIDQDDVPAAGMGESGFGDVVQSIFFSPKEPTSSGWIWGAGPVLLLPTASDAKLGGEKWGAGPTAVFLKQEGSWTYGFLANHIESFAGESNRPDVSATFFQPFVSYLYGPSKTTFVLNAEMTQDWENNETSLPVNFQIKQMLKVGDQIMQAGIGARYWVDSASNGPDGWGLRVSLTFLFPK